MKSITIRTKKENIKKAVYNLPTQINKKESILAKSGAKIIPLGNGWYRVSGYSHDGSDTDRTVREITE